MATAEFDYEICHNNGPNAEKVLHLLPVEQHFIFLEYARSSNEIVQVHIYACLVPEWARHWRESG